MDVESGDLEDDSWADGLATSATAGAVPAAAVDLKEGCALPQPAASVEDEKPVDKVAQMRERWVALGERLGVSPYGDADAFLEAAESLPLSAHERRELEEDLWWYRRVFRRGAGQR